MGGMTDKYETHEVVSYHPFAGKVFNKREIMDMMLPSMVGYDECGHNYSGMSVCSGIFNREIIERNSIYFCSERTYISEDVIFDIEFMSHCNIVAIVESAGYNYYHNVGTLTTKYRPERFEQIKKLYLYEIQIIADKDNYANLCRRIESMFLANLRVAIMQEVNYRGLDWKKSNKAIESMICDVAMFCIYSLYNKRQVDRLIAAYFTEGCSDETRIKIYCYIAACGLLWSNWCEYKRNLGVEFGEYSLRQYRYAKDYYRIVQEELKKQREEE